MFCFQESYGFLFLADCFLGLSESHCPIFERVECYSQFFLSVFVIEGKSSLPRLPISSRARDFTYSDWWNWKLCRGVEKIPCNEWWKRARRGRGRSLLRKGLCVNLGDSVSLYFGTDLVYRDIYGIKEVLKYILVLFLKKLGENKIKFTRRWSSSNEVVEESQWSQKVFSNLVDYTILIFDINWSRNR